LVAQLSSGVACQQISSSKAYARYVPWKQSHLPPFQVKEAHGSGVNHLIQFYPIGPYTDIETGRFNHHNGCFEAVLMFSTSLDRLRSLEDFSSNTDHLILKGIGHKRATVIADRYAFKQPKGTFELAKPPTIRDGFLILVWIAHSHTHIQEFSYPS
jgi:hypothetical protein